MKKLLSLTLGLLLLGSINANAWWWTEEEITCKASYSITVTSGPIEVVITDEWEGTKTRCTSGDNWCFSGVCN